ncbi:heme peroxidase [Moniliophthora roreri]|nr:heme peroxidase [Moniliophthora roreri]
MINPLFFCDGFSGFPKQVVIFMASAVTRRRLPTANMIIPGSDQWRPARHGSVSLTVPRRGALPQIVARINLQVPTRVNIMYYGDQLVEGY